ncbi:hypothetical protein LXA43DRAFT_166730 [Ganoderma leucocontextum]|nr:hypothetical protein LXA43DRAFT_166730 [Ganoderma leucocontextum]
MFNRTRATRKNCSQGPDIFTHVADRVGLPTFNPLASLLRREGSVRAFFPSWVGRLASMVIQEGDRQGISCVSARLHTHRGRSTCICAIGLYGLKSWRDYPSDDGFAQSQYSRPGLLMPRHGHEGKHMFPRFPTLRSGEPRHPLRRSSRQGATFIEFYTGVAAWVWRQSRSRTSSISPLEEANSSVTLRGASSGTRLRLS